MKVVDDRLILAGADYTIQDSSKSVILKIDFNGNFDDRFGVNGKYLVDVHEFDDPWPFSGEFFYRIQTDEDNNLFVAGKSFLYDYILKLNMDGTPDLSFGSNGFKYHNYPNNDFVISNDGTFLLHGGGFSLTRLNQNGDLDTTFGTNGTFIINISEETNYSHCINIQDDEKIILSGTSRKNDDPNFTLARLIIEPFVQEVDIVNNSNDIIVYPNPFSERIIIKSSQEFISDVFVYDIYGKLRVNSKVNKKETNLALNLPEGMYSCVIYTHNGKHFIKKIIALKK